MRYFSTKRCVFARIHSTKCVSQSASRCWRMLMTAGSPHLRQRIPFIASPARNHGDQLDVILVAEHRAVVDQLAVLDGENGLGIQTGLYDQFAHGDVARDLPLLISAS